MRTALVHPLLTVPLDRRDLIFLDHKNKTFVCRPNYVVKPRGSHRIRLIFAKQHGSVRSIVAKRGGRGSSHWSPGDPCSPFLLTGHGRRLHVAVTVTIEALAACMAVSCPVARYDDLAVQESVMPLPGCISSLMPLRCVVGCVEWRKSSARYLNMPFRN